MKSDVIDHKMASRAIIRMRKFYDDLSGVFEIYGMNLGFDISRRNMVMSGAQERFFADEIMSKYPDAICDGRSGEPDITIPSISSEIECKITSPGSRGNVNFRTDYITLASKGKLDFLYLIADNQFENFAVLYFRDITTNDFRVPSKSSRDKSEMIKHRCMDRCTSVIGDVVSINKREIDKINRKISKISEDHQKKVDNLNSKICLLSPGTVKHSKTLKSLQDELLKFSKRVLKLNNRVSSWQQKNEMFSIKMVPLNQLYQDSSMVKE